MRFILISFLFYLPISIHAQDYCIKNRFSSNPYFSASETNYENNISYGNAEDWYNGIVQNSYNTFDIAYPNPTIDPLEKRPLIILVHGGGYINGDKLNLYNYLSQLSQAGYVVASINYRLGWDSGSDPSSCEGDAESLSEAIYKATQDVHAAIRYLFANADDYAIDTNKVFAGGLSAGSLAVLNAVFCNQDDFNALHPGFESEFGPINNSVNDIDIHFSVDGILNLWGAILDIDAINETNAVPFISFYGSKDKIIPPETGAVYSCEDDGYEIVSGSEAIQDKLNELEICNQLHISLGANHDAYGEYYVIPNIACFVKQILCGDCEGGEFNDRIPDCSKIIAETPEIESENTHLLVFPNPASQTMNFVLKEMHSHDISIEIRDLSGKIIYRNSYYQSWFSIDVSDFPSGIYEASIETSEGISYEKLSIVH